ncbi:glycosyltransferase family 2 protein [Fibrobacter sp. UWB12]|uniref:glycosyltransferase family 2 protein n=1 Tax=Fibrobacter sp. UWB12 TaxID=1896203 RepID=UPI0009242C13|nr:glycosyltransferase family 2 protein [Fibrobacter sp. UWB12]SHK89416.1 Glycosyltransferase involved in cell wall bisynthesis [Fibrobacter sp. UWB12]
MHNPLISVVVPVYNVEQYIRECVDSIVSQTYCHLEIVLIDDGSLDNCPVICDEYAKKDSRIKVIHQKNGGLAEARNVGIENSSGEYITFIDSDDYIASNYIEILYRGIIENNADVSIASFRSFEKNNTAVIEDSSCQFATISKKRCFENYTSIFTNPFVSAWNKLYKRNLFLNIRFPEGKLYEDAFTTYKIFDVSQKIVFTSSVLYFYRLNPDSIMGQSFRKKHLEMIDAFRSGFDYFEKKDEKDISELFIAPLLMREIYCWWGVKKLLKDDKLAKKILGDYKKDSKNLKKTNNIGILWFLIFKIITFCPWLYVWYRKLSPSYMGDRK